MTRDPLNERFSFVGGVGPISFMRGRGIGWVRVFGWGIHWNRRRMLFSERNGYVKFVKIGPWRIRFLKRSRRLSS